jgi:hypothetical protein
MAMDELTHTMELPQLLQHPEKTCISRVTVAQEVRVALPAADFARRVQVLIPAGRPIYLDEDRPVEINADGSAPDGYAGRNRVYKLPLLEPGQQIEFGLASGQSLVAATGDGLAHLTLIVEPLR